MNLIKLLAISALATMAVMVFAINASATTLEVGGTTKNSSVSIEASIKSGTSLTLTDTFGISQTTCVTSELVGSTSSPFTGASVTGAVSILFFHNCTREVVVHKPGKLEVTWTSGTNGSVASEEWEVTFGSPVGTLNCLTGATTKLGTLTGVASGNATVSINAALACTTITTGKLEGTYSVTFPSGLGVSS